MYVINFRNFLVGSRLLEKSLKSGLIAFVKDLTIPLTSIFKTLKWFVIFGYFQKFYLSSNSLGYVKKCRSLIQELEKYMSSIVITKLILPTLKHRLAVFLDLKAKFINICPARVYLYLRIPVFQKYTGSENWIKKLGIQIDEIIQSSSKLARLGYNTSDCILSFTTI